MTTIIKYFDERIGEISSKQYYQQKVNEMVIHRIKNIRDTLISWRMTFSMEPSCVSCLDFATGENSNNDKTKRLVQEQLYKKVCAVVDMVSKEINY